MAVKKSNTIILAVIALALVGILTVAAALMMTLAMGVRQNLGLFQAPAARELGKVPSALTYNVRQLEDALDVLLFDRKSVQDFVYGRNGVATPNWLNNPARYNSTGVKNEFSIEKANAVLDAAAKSTPGPLEQLPQSE